jgi:hypothetical protein
MNILRSCENAISNSIHGWHRQELPVAEGREVFIYDEWLGSRLQKSIYPFGHRPFC